MPDTIDGQLVVGFNPTILRGQDGRSITSTTVDNNGHLILSFSDNTTVDVGLVTNGVTQVDGQSGIVNLSNKYAALATTADMPALWVTAHGNDANDGRSPGNAKATVSAAIAAAAALGGGLIQLGAGSFGEAPNVPWGVQIRGAGSQLTKLVGMPGSSNPGVITFNSAAAVQFAHVSDLAIQGNLSNATQCGIYAQGVASGSGLWDTRFRNLWITNCASHCIWLRGGTTTGLQPIQFLAFESVTAIASTTGYALMISGQVGQVNFDSGCRFDGPGMGAGLTNIRINRECSDAFGNTIISAQAPYTIKFDGVTSQSNTLAVMVDVASLDIEFDGLHVESCTNGVDTQDSAVVTLRNPIILDTGTGAGGFAGRAGAACTLFVEGGHPGTATQSWITSGSGVVRARGSGSASAYAGAGHTSAVNVAAGLTLNTVPTWLVVGDGGTTPLATITSNLNPGEMLHLKAWTNSFKIASTGNIDLSGRVSPVVVAANQVATLIRFDLGPAWQLLSVQ